jgi:ribose transport system ATP-binding protein
MTLQLSVRNIVKRYGGVVALRDGNLDIQSGEVVSLIGANGSGKSTLSKIITGVVAPNGGQLLLNGQSVHFPDPQAARARGITAVYQELSLVPDMTVAENIWLAHEPLRLNFRLNRQAMRKNTEELIALFGGTVSERLQPDTLVMALPPDERQIVEILKALSLDPQVLILDEATASLDSSQVNRLFALVRQWQAAGKAVIFITHRMDEIFRIADKVTVLRNGQSVGTVDIASTSEREIVNMMIESATTPDDIKIPAVADDAPVRLDMQHVSGGRVQDVSFALHDGELIGLGGLHGQGQEDLLLALFGAIPYTGSVTLSGQAVHYRHPRDAMNHDIAFVPGDRGREGLLLVRSIVENFQLPSWAKYGRLHHQQAVYRDARAMADDLQLVYAGMDAPVNSLSGGNAQKVVLGKWLLRAPKVLLLDDPTKGVDVGTKGEFYALLKRLTEAGTAILFYSSDDDELLGLCNRVLVLQDGRVRDTLTGDRLTHSELVAASMGATNNHEVA